MPLQRSRVFAGAGKTCGTSLTAAPRCAIPTTTAAILTRTQSVTAHQRRQVPLDFDRIE